jgi:hypothetical protein
MEMEQTRRTEEKCAGLELNGSTRPRGRTLIWSWVRGVSSSSHANSPMKHKFATYSRELARISARWRGMRTIEPCWSGSCIGSLREWQGLGTISSRTFDGRHAGERRHGRIPRCSMANVSLHRQKQSQLASSSNVGSWFLFTSGEHEA